VLADDAGMVECLLFVTLPQVTNPDACTDDPSMSLSLSAGATPEAISEFKANLHAGYVAHGDAGVDLSVFTTCVLRQVLPAQFVGGTCRNNAGTDAGEQGWCYVTTQGLMPSVAPVLAAGGSLGRNLEFATHRIGTTVGGRG
jgi:hypothetical protein